MCCVSYHRKVAPCHGSAKSRVKWKWSGKFEYSSNYEEISDHCAAVYLKSDIPSTLKAQTNLRRTKKDKGKKVLEKKVDTSSTIAV